MLVVLSYYQGDRDLAIRLLNWMNELGPYLNHELLIFREEGTQPFEVQAQFKTIETKSFVDPFKRWPISTTNAFQVAARYIGDNQKQPFLFLEPDCVPIKKDWLNMIEMEYGRTQKPFMGAFVPGISDSPDHMSGIGVYPGEVIKYAGQALLLSEEAPWDLVAADMIRSQAHFTDLIQHRWDRPAHPPFKSLEEFNAIVTRECVLFHADKSGSVIELLREQNLLSGGVESRHAGSTQPLPVSAGVDQASVADGLTRESQGSGSSDSPVQNPLGSRELGLPENQHTVTHPGTIPDSTALLTENALQKKWEEGPYREEYLKLSRGLSPDMAAPTGEGFQSLGDAIRFHVEALVTLAAGKTSRQARILSELRRAKLAPRPRKRT